MVQSAARRSENAKNEVFLRRRRDFFALELFLEKLIPPLLLIPPLAWGSKSGKGGIKSRIYPDGTSQTGTLTRPFLVLSKTLKLLDFRLRREKNEFQESKTIEFHG